MIKERLQIEGIPAVIWGEKADQVFVAVHGNMSHKEDTVIELLARQAVEKGYQVLSFDLPEHGERKDKVDTSKVETYIKELSLVMEEVQKRWHKVSLFACSMGAYFSLQTYQDMLFEKVLFLSPLISMEALINGVMQGFSITEERLQKEQTIETPIGMTLYWSYYSYVKSHPTKSWKSPTYILYGGKDDMCARAIVEKFTSQFGCNLKIDEEAEHYFHTKDQLDAYKKWLEETL